MAPCGSKTVGCTEIPIPPSVLAQSSRTGTLCNNGGGVHWASPVMIPPKRNNPTKLNTVGVLTPWASNSNGQHSKSRGEQDNPGSRISGIFTQDGKTVSGNASAAKAILTSCPGSYSEFLLEGRTEIHDRAVSGKF